MNNYKLNGSRQEIQVCSIKYVALDDTPWTINNSLVDHIPVLSTQLAVVVFIMRFLMIVLKPFHQSRFSAELIVSALSFCYISS